MLRPDREIKGQETIEEILTQGRELRLAMNDGEYPYLLPLNYGYADNRLYLHCARKGKKLECLRSNPKVSFEVSEVTKRIGGGQACQWSTKFRSVLGYGTAHIVDEREEKIQGYDVIMTQFGGPTGNYDEKNLKGSLVIRIDIESMTAKQS